MTFRLPLKSSILARATQCNTAATKHSVSGRGFSTTPVPQTKTIKPRCLPEELIPAYPFDVNRFFKQSNLGLYGGAQLHYGNTVSGRGNKSRRVWRPNVHVKMLDLPTLKARIRTRLTLRVLRTIRREGGLEAYLLKDKPQRVKEFGVGGWNLRWLLMRSRPIQKKFNDQRAALGLPRKPVVNQDDLIHYALDSATPGPLNASSRKFEAELRAKFSGPLVLGDEEVAAAKNAEELSDEQEAELLEELDETDKMEEVAAADSTKRHEPRKLWGPKANIKGMGKANRKAKAKTKAKEKAKEKGAEKKKIV